MLRVFWSKREHPEFEMPTEPEEKGQSNI